MATEVKPIRSKRDYEARSRRLNASGERRSERARVTASTCLRPSSIAYETEHYPMDPPDPIEAIK
jgi:HTH-type transcriptional regulator / antitoxin HigA